MTLWNENRPAANSLFKDFPSEVTRNVVAFREGIEKQLSWRSSSGLSAGEPSFVSGPGTARALFVTQSQLTVGADNGRLAVLSNTTEWAVLTNNNAIVQGGGRAIVAYPTRITTQTVSYATVTAGSYWLVQSGSSIVVGGPVVFPIAYSDVAPQVYLTPILDDAYNNGAHVALQAVTKSSFSVREAITSGASWGFYWMSEGTTTLT